MKDGSIVLKYLPDDKDFKNPKKVTWLPYLPEKLSKVMVVEYDHILKCNKPDEEQDILKFVNYDSKFET